MLSCSAKGSAWQLHCLLAWPCNVCSRALCGHRLCVHVLEEHTPCQRSCLCACSGTAAIEWRILVPLPYYPLSLLQAPCVHDALQQSSYSLLCLACCSSGTDALQVLGFRQGSNPTCRPLSSNTARTRCTLLPRLATLVCCAGTIPPELGLLSNLSYFNVMSNQLTGMCASRLLHSCFVPIRPAKHRHAAACTVRRQGWAARRLASRIPCALWQHDDVCSR